jgi:hypothetical protein
MTANLTVCASQVLSTQDLKLRPERDVTEIVGRFLSAAEAVVASLGRVLEGAAAVRDGAGRRTVRGILHL